MRRRLPGFPSAARTIGWGDIGRAASGCCAAGARRPLDTGVNRNRGIGYDVLHVCIDDASRLAYTGFDT